MVKIYCTLNYMYPVGTLVDTTRAHYPTSINAIKKAGFYTADKKSDPPIVWIDGIMFIEEAEQLKCYQRINKIPCMDYICFKSTLFEELNNLRKKYSNTMNFYPLTYLLPNEYPELQRYHSFICGRKSEAPTWVIKPKNGSCGKGIYFIQSSYEAGNITRPSIAQQMVDPYLLDGLKFDFRLYLLISSLDPFSAFIYKEGIARFCTEPYSPPSKANRDHFFMNLTNTAINIGSSKSPDQFTKRSSEVIDRIIKMRPDAKSIWPSIVDLSRKLLASIYPTIIATLPSNGGKKIRHFIHDTDAGEDGKIKTCLSPRRAQTSASRIRSQSQTRNQLSATTPRYRQASRNSRLNSNTQSFTNSPKRSPNQPKSNTNSVNSNTASITSAETQKQCNTANSSEKVSNTTEKVTDLQNQSNSTEITTIPANSNVDHNSSEKVNTQNELNSSKNDQTTSEKVIIQNESNSVQNDQPSSEKVQPDSNSINFRLNSETAQTANEFSPDDITLSPSQHYFQLLGMDIILDSDLQPKLLELNDRPSLCVTVPFESDLKTNMMREMFYHIGYDGKSLGEREESGWQQVLPVKNTGSEIYNEVRKIMSNSSNVKYTGRIPANSPTTKRMVSSGINANLHRERRQRAAELRESSRERRFNNYLKSSPY